MKLLSSMIVLLFLLAGDPQPFFHFQPAFPDKVGPKPTLFGSANDRLIVFDGISKRLHLVSQSGEDYFFGELGTGNGQLYEPSAIAANSTMIAEIETTSQRIQWFDAQGHFKHSCKISPDLDTRTAAFTMSNELLVNDSHAAKPILIIDQNCKTVGAFGSRHLVSDLYTSKNVSRDGPYKDAANRLYIATDKDDTFTASFVAPVLTKFDKHGDEIFRINLDHAVDSTFWSYSTAKGGMSTSLDGVQVPYITRGVSVDPVSHHIFVLATRNLHGDDALYDISPDGKQVITYPIHTPTRGDLYTMTVMSGSLYVSLVFSDGLFKSPLPIDVPSTK
jgi:hypothetical protein